MPKRVLHRRGTTAAHAVFTGGQGEFTYDIDKRTVVAHDGSTPGGFAMARADQVLAMSGNLSELNSPAAARSNLSVLSKIESYAQAHVRGFAGGVSFDGVSGQRLFSSLGSYSIATNHFSVRTIIRVPTSTSLVRSLFLIGSSSSAAAANSFAAVLLTSGALQIRLYGASTSDYTYAEVAGFLENYGGKAVEILVVRSFSGLTVYLNGVAATVGATFAYGTGPGWSGSITSTYLVFGNGVEYPLYGDLYALSLFNYAVPASEALKLAQEGINPTDIWSDDGELIVTAVNQDFSGANQWANTSMTTFNAAGDLSLTSNAVGQIASLPSVEFGSILTGRRYQICADVTNLSGNFSWRGSGALVQLDNITSGRSATIFEHAAASFGDLQIVSNYAGATVDIDNISLKPAGAMLDLDFSEVSKYFLPDRSTNRFHGVLVRGTSPVVAVRINYTPRRGVIFGRTNTNGNQQLLGQRCFPSNGRISHIGIVSDNSGVATSAVNIGTASGGSQIANAVPIVSGRNEVGTFASRLCISEEIWINANGTSNLDFAIYFDVLEP